jgi:hypothetical protein
MVLNLKMALVRSYRTSALNGMASALNCTHVCDVLPATQCSHTGGQLLGVGALKCNLARIERTCTQAQDCALDPSSSNGYFSSFLLNFAFVYLKATVFL